MSTQGQSLWTLGMGEDSARPVFSLARDTCLLSTVDSPDSHLWCCRPNFVPPPCLPRILFWTDWDASLPRIEAASMSGAGRRTIHRETGSGGWPNGLTVDYLEKRILWIDARSGASRQGRGGTSINKDEAKRRMGVRVGRSTKKEQGCNLQSSICPPLFSHPVSSAEGSACSEQREGAFS